MKMGDLIIVSCSMTVLGARLGVILYSKCCLQAITSIAYPMTDTHQCYDSDLRCVNETSSSYLDNKASGVSGGDRGRLQQHIAARQVPMHDAQVMKEGQGCCQLQGCQQQPD